MKTFRLDTDNQRAYLKSNIDDDYAEFEAARAGLLRQKGVRQIQKISTFEGPIVDMEFNNTPFSLVFDEMLGGFVYVEAPENLRQVEQLIEAI